MEQPLKLIDESSVNSHDDSRARRLHPSSWVEQPSLVLISSDGPYNAGAHVELNVQESQSFLNQNLKTKLKDIWKKICDYDHSQGASRAFLPLLLSANHTLRFRMRTFLDWAQFSIVSPKGVPPLDLQQSKV